MGPKQTTSGRLIATHMAVPSQTKQLRQLKGGRISWTAWCYGGDLQNPAYDRSGNQGQPATCPALFQGDVVGCG